jgi:hypothetical protein
MTTVQATLFGGGTSGTLSAYVVLYAGVSQDRHVAQKPGSTKSRAPLGHVLIRQTAVEGGPLNATGGPGASNFDHFDLWVLRRLFAVLSG